MVHLWYDMVSDDPQLAGSRSCTLHLRFRSLRQCEHLRACLPTCIQAPQSWAACSRLHGVKRLETGGNADRSIELPNEPDRMRQDAPDASGQSTTYKCLH